MAKSYESLMGAIGRSMFYRPERQRVRELFSRDAHPQLVIGGHDFPLFDMSMNGFSFLAPGGLSGWAVGDEIEVSLSLHDERLYEGPARVARIEQGPRGARVGLGLVTGFLDLPAIRRRDEERQLRDDLNGGPAAAFRRVPTAFRELVSRKVHFLGYYRRSLAKHERRYRELGGGDSASLELAERTYAAIREPWWELEVAASRAAYECIGDRAVLLAAKDYTETVLTPLVLDSPMGFRSYTKPLGYAGDFQVMLYIYGNRFEGETAFGKVIHKWYVADFPVCAGIRTRKDYVAQCMGSEHERVVARRGESAVFRVVGLGCGPAREVSEYIARRREWQGEAVWTLIDQEEEALSVAYRESRAEIAKWGSTGQLHLLNLSFVQLLSEGLPLQAPGTQDYIYSAGLFDYLRESRAQSLIRGLYDLLAEDGLMVIGNVKGPDNDCFFGTEFLVDWSVLWRSREEMMRLAALLPESAEIEVDMDSSGIYHFLRVRKH